MYRRRIRTKAQKRHGRAKRSPALPADAPGLVESDPIAQRTDVESYDLYLRTAVLGTDSLCRAHFSRCPDQKIRKAYHLLSVYAACLCRHIFNIRHQSDRSGFHHQSE